MLITLFIIIIFVRLYFELLTDDPQTFELEFRLAQNYPVDLYYLMDLSNSMKDDKENLANLGIKIGLYLIFMLSFLLQGKRLGNIFLIYIFRLFPYHIVWQFD